jgi:hypothetical protein
MYWDGEYSLAVVIMSLNFRAMLQELCSISVLWLESLLDEQWRQVFNLHTLVRHSLTLTASCLKPLQISSCTKRNNTGRWVICSTHTIVIYARQVQKMRWKKGDISSKPCAFIGLQQVKWKNLFVKDHISRNVDTTGWHIKALKTFVFVAIAKKDTLSRSKLKLARVERT